MKRSKFKFKMRQVVELDESNECGTVIGQARFAYSENSYLVRYKAADGRQVERWWGESTITAA